MQEYSAQFTFREQWLDPRLAYGEIEEYKNADLPKFVVLATSEKGGTDQQIWMPDTFFQVQKFIDFSNNELKKLIIKILRMRRKLEGI